MGPTAHVLQLLSGGQVGQLSAQRGIGPGPPAEETASEPLTAHPQALGPQTLSRSAQLQAHPRLSHGGPGWSAVTVLRVVQSSGTSCSVR